MMPTSTTRPASCWAPRRAGPGTSAWCSRRSLSTGDRITDGDPDSWFDAWTGLGADLAARGEEALEAGQVDTAR
ncbi:hypothetical protein [Streptomyces sp. BK208]|uniref:hypothetical protein n=1 Tax=Streptomyces sp. BK208 TaxID=2512150 RepID=UPI001060722D|nr:hypothetical protein [Streptomyces sp. BK208]